MKAIIEVDVPDYQIGQEVSIYFKDTMMIKGVVQEPKTGHWVYEPQKRMINETDEGVEYSIEYRCKCSNCDADYGFGKMKDAYCRYCGAKMKSEDKE